MASKALVAGARFRAMIAPAARAASTPRARSMRRSRHGQRDRRVAATLTTNATARCCSRLVTGTLRMRRRIDYSSPRA
jgi:hypothetical protein